MADKKNRLIVALDVNDPGRALELVDRLKSCVEMFKVGMELFYSGGGKIVEDIKGRGCKVFLDLKLHDIPNTVARAARVLTGLGVDVINFHAAGGPEMMKEALSAVHEESSRLGINPPAVIAVTVLTSINAETLNDKIGVRWSVEDCVVKWALMVRDCGLDGVVASPREVSVIRKHLGRDFIIITPGVRPEGSEAGDQKRIMTPSGAIKAGSTYIVVGRPITGSEDPLQSALRIQDEIKGCVN